MQLSLDGNEMELMNQNKRIKSHVMSNVRTEKGEFTIGLKTVLS